VMDGTGVIGVDGEEMGFDCALVAIFDCVCRGE